jgi:DNA-binding transcriptional LysR family regulator
LPGGHAAAETRRVSLSKLKNDPWVLWHREIASRLHDEFIAACGSAGFEPKVAQRTVRLATVVSLVASGVGLALIPVTAARMGIRGVVFRPLAGTPVLVPMSFVWRRREVAPGLAPFMAAVREAKPRPPLALT